MEDTTRNHQQLDQQSRRLTKEIVAEGWQALFLNLPIHQRTSCLRRLVRHSPKEAVKAKYPLVFQ